MCPYSKICSALITGFITTEILLCNLKKEECPYLVHREHLPHEQSSAMSVFQSEGVVVASGSSILLTSEVGRYISDLQDGRKMYYVNIKNMNITEGTFRIVDSEGKESFIGFERPIDNEQ